jgi:hypothetical protein
MTKTTTSTPISNLPPAVVDMLSLQAELCGVGIAIVGVWDGDRLLMVRDTDAERKAVAWMN